MQWNHFVNYSNLDWIQTYPRTNDLVLYKVNVACVFSNVTIITNINSNYVNYYSSDVLNVHFQLNHIILVITY